MFNNHVINYRDGEMYSFLSAKDAYRRYNREIRVAIRDKAFMRVRLCLNDGTVIETTVRPE